MDIYELPYQLNTKVDYDFYQKYLGSNHFKEKFESRIEYIKNKYENNKITNNKLIEEYFVEIFSWSVIPRDILSHIHSILKENNIKLLLDPCCGNAFHTFLFDVFCGYSILANDNDPNEYSWNSCSNKEGIQFLHDLNDKEHEEGALILSWIEGEELAYKLLESFFGNVVISIGNYENNTRYIDDLNYYYKLKCRIVLEMPWNLNEKIEIYIRKEL